MSKFSTLLFALVFLLIISCKQQNNSPIPENFVRIVVDTNPPVIPLSPQQSIKKIQLPPGFHVELVASEPMVQEAVAICWDGNGRMYVGKWIKLLDDTDGDGKMDKANNERGQGLALAYY